MRCSFKPKPTTTPSKSSDFVNCRPLDVKTCFNDWTDFGPLGIAKLASVFGGGLTNSEPLLYFWFKKTDLLVILSCLKLGYYKKKEKVVQKKLLYNYECIDIKLKITNPVSNWVKLQHSQWKYGMHKNEKGLRPQKS